MERNKWPICFVGQGPSMTAWRAALLRAGRFGHFAEAEEYAMIWCARVAITGRLGEFLARLSGVERLTLYSRCERRNLNARWNGKVGKGDAFNVPEGRETAVKIKAESEATHFVLLGAHVARCFGFSFTPLAVWDAEGGPRNTKLTYLLLPHPSGVNQWWNHPKNKAEAQRALRLFLRVASVEGVPYRGEVPEQVGQKSV